MLFTDNSGDTLLKPFRFHYHDVVWESLPLMWDERLEMLLDFLDYKLQMDPDRCAMPNDLLRMI